MLASKIFIMCPIPSLQFSYIDHKIENPMRIFAKNDYFCSQINNINTKQVMKKVLFTLTLAFLATTWSFAQENDNTNQKLDSLQQVVNKLSSQIDEDAEADMQQKIWKDRAKYFNLSYVIQKLQYKDIDGLQHESDFGVAISRGRTYYLHKKPILKMIKFGIDWTQFDINYAKYGKRMGNIPSNNENDNNSDSPDGDLSIDLDELDLGMHQLDFGMHFGLSLTVNPVSHLKVNGYYRFAPTGSLILLDDEVSVQFVPFNVFGGAISYKVISVGVEARKGSAKYKNFSVNEDADVNIDVDSPSDLNIDNILNSDKVNYKTLSTRVYISFRF